MPKRYSNRACGTISLFALAAAMFLAHAAARAEDRPGKPKTAKDRLGAIESRLDEIEKILSEISGPDAPSALRHQAAIVKAKIEDIEGSIEELDKGAEDRDSRLDQIELDVDSMWVETQAIKEVVVEIASRRNAGYDEGFFVASDEGEFRLTVNGYVKPYYSATMQRAGKGEDAEIKESGFSFTNARLTASTALFEKVRGKLSIDYGKLEGRVVYPNNADIPSHSTYNRVEVDGYSLRILAAYAEYVPLPEIGVRAGQFKVPFDRETLFQENRFTFASRSLMNRSYLVWGDGRRQEPIDPEELNYRWSYETQRGSGFGWDRGVQISGSFGGGMLGYAVGAFNGSGPNMDNDNRDLLYSARVETEPLGSVGDDMSDLKTSPAPVVKAGAGVAYDAPKHLDEHDPAKSYNSSDISATLDAQLKWLGLSAMAAGFFRRSDYGAVYPEPIYSFGAMAQAAYFNRKTKLEPAFRYSIYDDNSALSGDHVHEIAAAIAYYMFGQNLKVELEYRGLFPAEKDKAYFSPWGVRYDDLHELIAMVQLGF